MATEPTTETLTPKLLTISVPEEATRNSPQTTPTRASAPPTANPSPALSLPFQHYPLANSPSPPASPSPAGKTSQEVTSPLLLGPRPPTPTQQPSGMVVDGPITPPLSTPEQVNLLLSQPYQNPGPGAPEAHQAAAAGNQATPLQALLDEEQEQEAHENSREISRDPLDKFTDAVMPKVYEAHPTANLEFIDRDLIGVWERYPGWKLIAIPFGSEAKEQSRHRSIRTRIFAAAAEITRSQTIAVAAPAPNERARKEQATPITFLIYKLDEEQHETLLQKGVWSSSAITFRVAPLSPSRPNFIFAITGLATGDAADVHEMVRKVWLDEHSVKFYHSIIESRSESDRPSTRQALETYVSAMYVQCVNTKMKGGILSPKFNVYTETKDIHHHFTWNKIRKFLANRTYKTTMLGQCSVVTKPHNCSICHGVDHPKGMCTFPTLPGWNGPVARTGAGQN